MKRFWTFGAIVLVVLLSSILIFAQDSVPTSPQGKIADNNNDFACNLFRTIYEQKQDGGSFVVSPISVGYLLGMLHEGADGETRRQINDVLGLGGSVQDINEYFKKIMDEAPNVDPTVTVKTANSIFVIPKFRLIQQYRDDMRKYYKALADTVNYNESNIVKIINDWCKKNTDGMIPEILKNGELNPNRVMYLLNAVYFKASWAEKFDPNQTRERNFTQLDGTTVNLPMMHLETRATYGKNDLCKLLRLPYGNGGYSMVVMLPNEGKTIGDIIKNLSAQSLKDLLHQMRSTKVDILLPRFTTENETHLEKVLSSMGMPRAFSQNAAEFPNMVQKHNNDVNDIYVSMMKQMAKIEVNEDGTKAAAVTIAEMSERSAMPNRPQREEFHATRPFVYFIVENSTGTIYFMGTYCGEKGEQVEIQGRKVNSSEEIFTAVDKTGKVGEIKVVRSVDRDLDKEAVRICKSLHDFVPGRQNGQAVSV